MKSDSNHCALCGTKLIDRGKIKKEFSTMNFSKDGKKPTMKPVCNDCRGKFSQ